MSTLVNLIIQSKKLFVKSTLKNSTFYYYPDGSKDVFLSTEVYKMSNGKKEKRDFVPEEEKIVYKKIWNRKAASSLRRLVKCNDLRYHWVLTYKDAGKSREEVADDFQTFVKRLRYYFKELKYVAVIEVQKKREEKLKEKALHFHFAVNQKVSFKEMSGIWGFGFVLVKFHKERNAGVVASYLAKYFQKQIDEDGVRGFNQKRYFCSKGLAKPVKFSPLLTEEDKEAIIKEAINAGAYVKEIFLDGGFKAGVFLSGEF